MKYTIAFVNRSLDSANVDGYTTRVGDVILTFNQGVAHTTDGKLAKFIKANMANMFIVTQDGADPTFEKAVHDDPKPIKRTAAKPPKKVAKAAIGTPVDDDEGTKTVVNVTKKSKSKPKVVVNKAKAKPPVEKASAKPPKKGKKRKK